jgi:hypothetical protein
LNNGPEAPLEKHADTREASASCFSETFGSIASVPWVTPGGADEVEPDLDCSVEVTLKLSEGRGGCGTPKGCSQAEGSGGSTSTPGFASGDVDGEAPELMMVLLNVLIQALRSAVEAAATTTVPKCLL